MHLFNAQPQIILEPSLPAAPALAIALLPDGNYALTSGLDFHLRLWDLERGVQLKSWDARGPLYDIQVIRAGKTALLAAVQGIVPWDLARWDLEQPNTLWSHSQINALAYCEATGELLGGGEDTTIHRWHLPSGDKLPSFVGHNITIYALQADPLGRRALSGDLYGTLRLWDLENDTCLRAWAGHPDKVSAVDLSPDGRWALTAREGGTITLWDLETYQPVRDVRHDDVTAACLSSDQARAYIGGMGGLACWDLATGERVWHYPEARVVDFSLSPDENTLAALVRSNHLLVWRGG